MKRMIIYLIALLLLTFAFSDLISDNSIAWGAIKKLLTEGTLQYTVRTVTYNGTYAPRNAGVIWITNSQNQFIKTLKIWAASYRLTLIRWIQNSGNNTIGAITSASLSNHQLHNVSWDGKDYQNIEVPDGEYKINVEFTEHNATASNLGKFKSITYTKGNVAFFNTYPNEAYFSDLSLGWEPIIVSNNENVDISPNLLLRQNYPNPIRSTTTIEFYQKKLSPASVFIYNLKGQVIRLLVQKQVKSGWNKIDWDLRDNQGKIVANGNYIISLQSDDQYKLILASVQKQE